MSHVLADILKQKKNQILTEWEDEVKSKLPPARLETKSALRNSIPVFLDDLIIALREGLNQVKPDIIRFAYKHGSERAYHSGYSIEDTLAEYNILRKVIFRILGEENDITSQDRDIILESIDFGMEKAGAEYANQSAKELNTLFELSGTGKAVVDPETGEYLKVNGTFCEMLGYTREEILQKKVMDLIHPEDMERQMQFMRKTIEHRSETLSLTKRYIRKDGTFFWVEVFVAPLPSSPDHRYRNVSTYIDVTTKKKIEDEQKKQLDELKSSEAIRDRFMSALSHDLRTPLTSAILSSQLIARKTGDSAVKALSKKIEQSLKRVDKMIEDLLDANRLRAGQKINLKIQEFDLSELVKSTVADLETIHGDRFVIDTPEAFTTHLSPQNIRRIIENLCSNAIKYGSTSAPVSIFVHPRGDKLELGVHNFGNPIRKEESNSLFRQFVRSKKDEKGEKKGWGIGLSIVKGVTEAHGGHVEIESDEEGTTFIVTLPVDARPFAGEGAQLH